MFGKIPDNSKLISLFIDLQLEFGQILVDTEGETYDEKMINLMRKNRAIPDVILSFDNYIKRLSLPAKALVQELSSDSSKIIELNRLAPDFIGRYRNMVKTMGMM